MKHLEKNKIETRSIMTGNIIQQPVCKMFAYKKTGKLQNSQYVTKNSFVIGNHHEMNEEIRKFIADEIYDFVSAKTKLL